MGISICAVALVYPVFWLLLGAPDAPQPSQCPGPSPRSALLGVLKRHRLLRTLSFHLSVAVLTSIQQIGSLCRESATSLAEVPQASRPAPSPHAPQAARFSWDGSYAGLGVRRAEGQLTAPPVHPGRCQTGPSPFQGVVASFPCRGGW